MKTKQVVVSTLVVLAIFILAACGGKYSDAIELSEKQIVAMEAYTENLEKADSAEKIVSAIESFTADMEKLTSKAQGLREKYPELYKAGAELPEEFAAVQKKTEAIVQRMTAASMKTVQYMMDPKVQQAMMKMNAVMMKSAG